MRLILFTLCCFALLAVMSSTLSPRQEESKEITKGTTRTISKITTTNKVVALTFDDGPHYRITPEILAILREKQVHATFFVVGINAAKFPNILAEEINDGHEIGNHSYSHKSLTKLSSPEINDELERAANAIQVVAPKITLFRPPGGLMNEQVFTAAQNRGYTTILWSVDSADWRRPSVEQLVNNVVNEVKPGSIILLHDWRFPSPTPQALSIIIDRLREQGYKFVTVSELLQCIDVDLQQ